MGVAGWPVASMGQGGIHCPLCDCYVFSDVAKYVSALSNLLVCPLTCPLPGCGHAVVGVAGLAEHVASHGPQHQAADNIDQVIRDIEELVDRESNTKVDNILEQSETSNHSMSSSFVFPNPAEESQTSENTNKLLESDLFDTAYRAPDPGHSNMSVNETHNYHWGQMIPAIATVKGSNTKAPAYGSNQPPHSINYQSSRARRAADFSYIVSTSRTQSTIMGKILFSHFRARVTQPNPLLLTPTPTDQTLPHAYFLL